MYKSLSYLLKLKFDWLRVHGCHSITDLVSDPESLLFTAALHLNEHTETKVRGQLIYCIKGQ